ncbi:hypothetical protein DYB37_006593 [Aphanomyces astaci]|uniref:Uncharacterized protein n=1 Tax=Aphanomyces astaci TaxID=112090 RepID=A0A3R7BV09_APHAT|nr:hypothetical protein DYB35_010267 [Aphanomyces astaci]RHZ24267.1 hypothetical protein DYB37_006593 [Aphanomyces astaci]
MSEGGSMSRDEFVKALAVALAANDVRDAPTSGEMARNAYDALQFDFPQTSPSELKALATHLRNDPLTFPLTYMLLRNVLELAHGTNAISSSAATVLAQCLFLPFQSPHHLDHFHLPIDPTAVLLQMEWMRYMYLLRDRILQYPVACASLLHKILLFFHAPNNEEAIDASGASTALLRLLLDIASSNELKQAAMAKSSIISFLRSAMPKLASQGMAAVASSCALDDVDVHAQLWTWAVLEDPLAVVPLLEDRGVLRAFAGFIMATTRDSAHGALKHALRLLVLSMLYRPSFAAYVHGIPSMAELCPWLATSSYSAEWTLWSMAYSTTAESFFTAFQALFPVKCVDGLAAITAMHEAVFVLEVLVKMRSQYSWIAWPHKSNLLTTLQTLLPTLNSLFQCPPKQDVTAPDDDNSSRSITTSSRQSIQLVHRMRVAIKQLAATIAHSHGDGAKLD